MSRIYEFPGKFKYFMNDEKCEGVGLWHKGKELNIMNNGDVICDRGVNFKKDDLCTLCIMFLLINKPEVITEDEIDFEK